MRRTLTILMVLMLGGALTAGAAVSNMTLDHAGTLYRLQPKDDRLVLSIGAPDVEPLEVPVPWTTGVEASYLLVDVDEATGTVVAAWQQAMGETGSRVMLATWKQGTWFGPVVVAGNDGAPAVHPTLLVHDTPMTKTDEDGNVTGSWVSSRIHLAWWQDPAADEGGRAFYATTTLDTTGLPDMSQLDPVEMGSLAPWGTTCNLRENSSGLTYPRLFVDAESGDVHLAFVSFTDCMFDVVPLHDQPATEDDTATGQRRRTVVVFGRSNVVPGRAKMVFIRPGLHLNEADFAVGHNLSIVLYWNGPENESVQYMTMNSGESSEVKTLPLSSTLNRQAAVELVRRLAQ
ncbi:MAG: hypothetical protein LJE95_11725 [Acidobacteria bacterium]|nr:hypothetical protein [Acidobacteriota bacterium]